MSERVRPNADELLRQGESAERRADYLGAVAAYRGVSTDPNPRVAALGVFRLGRVAWKQGRMDDAMEHYEQARTAAMDQHDDELRANAENGIGSVHCHRGAYTPARAVFRSALDLTREPGLRGRVCLNLGVLSILEGDRTQARELYESAVREFEGAHDDSGLAIALHNVGLLHADGNQWDEAEAAYAKALELSDALGDRPMIASVLLNRAELLCARSRFPDALEACECAMTIYTELGDDGGRAAVYRREGQAYRGLHRLDEAEPRLKEAIRIAGRLQLLMLEAEAARELALVKVGREDVVSAGKWLRRALARFSVLGAEREAKDVEDLLTTLKPWRPSGEQRRVSGSQKHE